VALADEQRSAVMLRVYVLLQNFMTMPLHRDDRGASAVEYGLLVGLIAVVIIAAVTLLGTKLSDLFGTITSSL
jgi:pilus assembly protein Flp/PilA